MIRNSVLQSSRRRLVVQLASLVDLLFVILFLQYMQLRLISHRQAVMEKGLRTHAEAAAKDAQGVTDQVVHNLEQLQNANRQLTEDLKNAEKRIHGLEGKSKEVARQAEEELLFVAKAAQDMLGVDLGPALRNGTQTDVDAIKALLGKLRTADPGAIVQHLRTTREIQKLCSIWDVHLNADGIVRLRCGEATRTFRPRDENDFAQQFVETSKEAGEPKSLVVVLRTFGDAQLAARQCEEKGLERAKVLLRAEWPNKRFVLATAHFSAAAPP
ncbi:MAG: hypothetical protein ACLP9L_32950 [Thermoguttaceae bacterium]